MADLKSALVYPADLEKAYVEAGYWTGETPPHWLAGWAARQPDAPAGVGMGAPLTYGKPGFETAYFFACERG